jgi:hypothetical protein
MFTKTLVLPGAIHVTASKTDENVIDNINIAGVRS